MEIVNELVTDNHEKTLQAIVADHRKRHPADDRKDIDIVMDLGVLSLSLDVQQGDEIYFTRMPCPGDAYEESYELHRNGRAVRSVFIGVTASTEVL
mgnify:CR=1 FL=1